MEISKATRTHLFYQFIIMTLLFFGNGYEILLDRKIILFLASVPIVCYQLIVLACCMDLIPVPPWMSFLQFTSKESNTEETFEKDFELCSSPVGKGGLLNSPSNEMVFPEVGEIFPSMRRWEKSVMNLGATPKCYVYPQKSKSWMNLSDSRSSDRLSSCEGSVDTIDSLTESKVFQFQTRSDKTDREERAMKAKSWKSSISDFKNCGKPEFVKSHSLKEHIESPPRGKKSDQEESELEKSYSFPFRQKRLQSWLEMKESTVEPSNQSPSVPYWQSVGYNLAVKYEARRRQRALLKPDRSTISNEDSNSGKSTEDIPESASTDKSSLKKSSKSASARITKLRVGISNLVLKKKEEMEENNNNSNKVGKSTLFKLRNKTSSRLKEKEQTTIPELPQFLSNDRPLIFYPKYLPFEKERFESDVKNKMVELTDEQNSNKHPFLNN